MKHKLTLLPLLFVWLLLAFGAWFLPDGDISESERRPLEQKPEFSLSAVLKGDYMADFESYSLDQFPLRDTFRRIKSLFHYYVLNQTDNNGIYLADGVAAKQEYPLNEASLDHAVSRFEAIYEKYLTDSRVFAAVIPDKGQYLAAQANALTLDYGEMSAILKQKMPWAVHVDLLDSLSAEDYYATDTHWRQEGLIHAAQTLCTAMEAKLPSAEEYTLTKLERPFYGVYYGQAALPLEPDTMYLLESPMLDQCRVYDYETGKTGSVYDLTKLDSRDLYDVYLSGAKSLLTIENPNGATDRELIIFRDSFGSAIAPLLVQEYARVTLVDIRYIQSSMLPMYLDFHGQDVLFLYSTLVLNNSETIK